MRRVRIVPEAERQDKVGLLTDKSSIASDFLLFAKPVGGYIIEQMVDRRTEKESFIAYKPWIDANAMGGMRDQRIENLAAHSKKAFVPYSTTYDKHPYKTEGKDIEKN